MLKAIKKISVAILILSLMLETTGCGPFKKKFTRKKKKEEPIVVYYELEKYARGSNAVLYKRHYIYWKTWQEELINRIGESRKKDMRCANGIISNLQDMKNLLAKEKGDELAPFIDEMNEIKKRVSSRSITSASKNRIRNTLEKRYRKIKRQFSYTKVKDCVLPDAKQPEGPQPQEENIQEENIK